MKKENKKEITNPAVESKKILPFGEYLLIKPLVATNKSGIIIVKSKDEQPFRGHVIEVGEGKEFKVAKGVEVIFKKFAGYEIDVDGELHVA